MDNAANDSATINEMNANEHIYATQVDAVDIETSASTEHVQIDREVGDDENSIASPKSRAVAEPSSASNIAAIQNADYETNGNNFPATFY